MLNTQVRSKVDRWMMGYSFVMLPKPAGEKAGETADKPFKTMVRDVWKWLKNRRHISKKPGVPVHFQEYTFQTEQKHGFVGFFWRFGGLSKGDRGSIRQAVPKRRMSCHTPENERLEPKNEGGWKMIFLFKQVIFRFHDSFQGCDSGSRNFSMLSDIPIF